MSKNIFVWNNSAVTSSILKKLSISQNVDNIYYADSRVIEYNKKIILLQTDGSKLLRELANKKVDYIFSNSEANKNKFIDYSLRNGLNAFGARYYDTKLESSKVNSKALMKKYGINTPNYVVLDNQSQIKDALLKIGLPCVIKADGPARGLSVVVIDNESDFFEIAQKYLSGYFGMASQRIIVEEYKEGIEVSIPLVLDGKTVKILNYVKDYKRKDNSLLSENTGGMGSISPFNLESKYLIKIENLIDRLSILLQRESIFYKGFMTLNITISNDEVFLFEINTRLGDSEGQTILNLLDNDLIELFDAMHYQKLDDLKLFFKQGYSVSVNVINNSYPNFDDFDVARIEKKSLDNILSDDIDVFFYKNVLNQKEYYEQGHYRFISLVSFGSDINIARNNIYSKLEKINGDNIYYRKDIGLDLLNIN